MNTEQLPLPLEIETVILQKRCSMCHKHLPITEFTYHKRGKYQKASQCRPCLRKYKQLPHVKSVRVAYEQNKKDKRLDKQKQYRLQHKEEISQYNKQYRESNLDRIKTRRKTLKAREYSRIVNMRYRSQRRQAKGHFTLAQFLVRCEYYGWCCYLCRKPLTRQTVVIEHRIPLSRNGTNWPANLAPSCSLCNSRKGNKTEIEYRASSRKVEVLA